MNPPYNLLQPRLTPVYNGLEIDMLALGDADSILVSGWFNGIPIYVLIDGGDKGSFSVVRAFLRQRGITYLHHVISTHPHEDHVGGLIRLVSDPTIGIGQMWAHDAGKHGDLTRLFLQNATPFLSARKLAKIEKSMSLRLELFQACEKRGTALAEPLAGQAIGFLRVCGPSVTYYNDLVPRFSDTSTLNNIEQSEQEDQADQILQQLGLDVDEDSLEDGPRSTPENDSSVILVTFVGQQKFLFTSDAGPGALALAALSTNLQNCTWMQIPHHGSRRSITNGLIELFRPQVAYVSAAGDAKHPRRAVVNAFKRAGTAVYSTHYPNKTNLRYHSGNVPFRAEYRAALALYDDPT